MSKPWPMVMLGEILRECDTSIPVARLGEIHLAGVYSFGRGLFKRGSMLPAETTYKTYNRLVTDDFVISQPKAWEGALARVTPEFNGWYLSPVFPTFRTNDERLEPKFLEWFCKRQSVWEELQRNSRGIGARRESVSPSTFLALKIPLPPLSEQKRITARLEELAAKVEEARGLRREAVEEAEALIDAFYFEIFRCPDLKSYLSTLGKADLRLNKESRDPRRYYSKEFAYVDISSVGKGPSILNKSKTLPIADAPSRARRVIRAGDIIFSTVRPNLRAIAKIGPELDNQICSTGFAVFSPGATLNADFVLYQLCSPFFINQCIAKTTGGHYPAINDTNLRDILFVAPPLKEQRRIVAYLDGLQAKVDVLKRLQSETAAELNAMLPSVLDRAFKGEWRINDSLYKKLQPIEIHQSRETTLERSTKLSVAAFAAMAYPATDTDRAICAAALAVVEQSGALTSMEHLDALLLATHPNWCKKFLNQNEQRAIDKALRSAPKGLFVAQGQSIRWNECRNYLEKLGAITVDHGANNQFVGTGTVMASTKVSFPAGVDEVVKIALDVLDSIRELRKDLASVPQIQRSILEAFAEQHRQYQLAA